MDNFPGDYEKHYFLSKTTVAPFWATYGFFGQFFIPTSGHTDCQFEEVDRGREKETEKVFDKMKKTELRNSRVSKGKFVKRLLLSEGKFSSLRSKERQSHRDA